MCYRCGTFEDAVAGYTQKPLVKIPAKVCEEVLLRKIH